MTTAGEWATAVAGGALAAFGIYKASDNYDEAQTDQAQRDALYAQGATQNSSQAMALASTYNAAAAGHTRAAIMYGVGAAIGAGIAVYSLWPKKKRK